MALRRFWSKYHKITYLVIPDALVLTDASEMSTSIYLVVEEA